MAQFETDNINTKATLVDRSGTVTAGGTSQVVAPANPNRVGFSLQNVSYGDLWISSNGPAVAGQPSHWLPAGSYWEYPLTGVPLTAINVLGATTGQAFTAREW